MKIKKLKSTFKFWFAGLCVFYSVLFFLCKDIPFFQDNILFSAKLPMHFFEAGFFNFPLPDHIDVGYPPLWAWLIALSWKIFGQQLWVGHLLCLPILIATAWFYLKIAAYFLPQKYLWFAALFLLIEPTYLAQSTMVGPDVFMVMTFMGGLYSIIYRKPYLLVLMTVLLSMTSVRGVIFTFILFVNQIVFMFYEKDELNWRIISPYTISAILFFTWIFFHYQTTGFLLVTDQSPWGTHHQLARFKNIGINTILTTWRFLDFGRIVLYVFIFLLFMVAWFKRKQFNSTDKILACWSFGPLLILLFILIVRTNPILHRYFIVYFLLHGLCLGVLLFKDGFSILKKGMLTVVTLALVCGHLWIYPNKDLLTQGWDASLAHVPYFNLRQQMIGYIEEEGIAYQQITTAFPNVNGNYYSDLSKEKWNFIPKHKLALEQSTYVMESNVMNDFLEVDLQLLQSEQFQLVKSYTKMGVYMNLYKRK